MSGPPAPAVTSITGATAARCRRGALVARRTVAFTALAAALLLGAPVARADHDRQAVGGASTDGVHVQPTASQFMPPHRPDVSASAARDIDALYRQLIGPKPSDSGSSARAVSPR